MLVDVADMIKAEMLEATLAGARRAKQSSLVATRYAARPMGHYVG
jgi:hypothetical protein